MSNFELFSEQIQSPVVSSWPPVILNATKSEIRSGLKDKRKNNPLTKYELREDLAFLKPSKINKEILLNLGTTVITRDKHQMQSQTQLRASLNALGSEMFDLSKLEWIQNL